MGFRLFLYFTGIKCPVCAKFVPPDDLECHLVICLTKPRITYNGKTVEQLYYNKKGGGGDKAILFTKQNQTSSSYT